MNRPPREARPTPTHHSDPPRRSAAIDEVDDTLKRLMPWAVSFLLHAAFVVVAMLLVWATFQPDPDEQHRSISALADTPAAPWPLPLPMDEPIEDPAPTTSNPSPDASPFDSNPAPIRKVNLPTTGFTNPAPSPTPGDSWGTSGPSGPGGTGVILPPVAATKTVFVIDASGSVIDTFPFVVNELRRTLDAMGQARTQSHRPYEFAVIFFRNGETIEVGGPGTGLARGLKPATPENVAKALQWLRPGGSSIGPGGRTDPMPAIRLALSYNPQAVVLLSDNITGQGIYALDPDGMIDAVMDARGDRRIVFDTVQFLYPDVAETYGQTGTLERLAEQTGGTYKFVSSERLNLR